MRRVFRKGMAVALAAAMVVTLAPASADAAKKPSIAKKASVKVGKSTKIKVKNGKAKATVTWKTSKKSVAKLGKQVKKGNKASVVVKGVKKGKATITATYKLGKKKTNLKCVVTVSGTTTPAAATTAPAAVATATATAAAPTATATAKPTEAPTKAPSATPKPSPTPSPRPKNTNLDAYGLNEGTEITVDGVMDGAWEDCKANDLLTDITKESGVRGGESKVTDAKAYVMWGANVAYVLVDVKKANADDKDSVTIYFDENAKATKDTVQSATIKAGEADKSVKTADGYVVEAKFEIKTAKEVDSAASIEIQINEDKVTTNYYDTRSAQLCDETTGEWSLGDAAVTVKDDPSKMGQLTLLAAMPKSKLAYKTTDGAAIRAAADIDNGEWDVPAEEGAEQTVMAKKVKFVDPKFWTEVYGANEPIVFSNCNPSAYAPDDRKSDNITLMKKIEDGVDEEGNPKYKYEPDASLAKGYVIWDEDYLYVMFDIADTDITVNDVDNPYLCDSTEFFFNEDNSNTTSYTEGGDEIQARVAAIDNAYSNEGTALTGSYKLVAHAAKVKEDGSGYYTQYIIKLNSKHKVNDIMGMDLQVNDCSSIDVVSTDETTGEEVTTKSSARACTITAYDTANEDWQNPSYFGRVKLIDRTIEGGDGDSDSVLKMDITKFASNDNVTVTKNDDGSVTLDWAETAADWSDIKLLFDAPKDLSGYTKYIVKTKGAEGESIFCASILDAEKKSEWNAPAPVGLRYGFATNTELTLDELKNADYNGNNEGGTDGDYTNVLGISFNKNNQATAVSVTITDIEFIK